LLFESLGGDEGAHMDVDGKIVKITLKESNVLVDGHEIIIWKILTESNFNLLCDELKKERNKCL
jgi:hypothetical protein